MSYLNLKIHLADSQIFAGKTLPPNSQNEVKVHKHKHCDIGVTAACTVSSFTPWVDVLTAATADG